jgi:hypothetical protein
MRWDGAGEPGLLVLFPRAGLPVYKTPGGAAPPITSVIFLECRKIFSAGIILERGGYVKIRKSEKDHCPMER